MKAMLVTAEASASLGPKNAGLFCKMSSRADWRSSSRGGCQKIENQRCARGRLMRYSCADLGGRWPSRLVPMAAKNGV